MVSKEFDSIKYIVYIHELETEVEREESQRTRRKELKCNFQPKLNIAKHNFNYQAILIFNKLPQI